MSISLPPNFISPHFFTLGQISASTWCRPTGVWEGINSAQCAKDCPSLAGGKGIIYSSSV